MKTCKEKVIKKSPKVFSYKTGFSKVASYIIIKKKWKIINLKHKFLKEYIKMEKVIKYRDIET